MASEWLKQFYSFTGYMRGRGWRCPFMLTGQIFTPVGLLLSLKRPTNDWYPGPRRRS